LNFVKFSPYGKEFQIKVVDLDEVYVFCRISVSCIKSFYEKQEADLSFM